MDEAFIVVSVISGIFGLVALELMSHNWFKKERFKFETYNLKKQNDLQLKKMARDLGIGTPSKQAPGPLSSGGGLLDLAKNLSPDQLGAIGEILQGRVAGGEGDGEILPEGLDGLIEFATKNPDIVKSFLKGAQTEGSGAANDFL